MFILTKFDTHCPPKQKFLACFASLSLPEPTVTGLNYDREVGVFVSFGISFSFYIYHYQYKMAF
jgi:hypothetical protein